MMELSSRKCAVLEAIVRAYIETGEPVGSKILTELMENAPSSATIRNEMSELTSLGLLAQPHVSAGRVPTTDAYRLFVNTLMRTSELNDTTKAYIDSMLSDVAVDAEKLRIRAAEILSALTGFTAFCYNSVDSYVTLKRVEILKISRHSVMLFMLTSDGRTRNSICRFDTPFTEELKEQLEDIIKNRLYRKPLCELNKAYLQNVVALSGLNSFRLMPPLTLLFDMADDAAQSRIYIGGNSGLYNVFGEEKARRVLSLLSRAEPISSLCDALEGDSGVIFGDDTPYADFKNTVMVVGKYGRADKATGGIGIIASDRMSYEQIVPSVEYMASRLTHILKEFKKDMED